MVEITIFIEGAVLAHDKNDTLTMDNSHRFRESFRKLFTKVFPEEDLTIIVKNGSGIIQTVNFFKHQDKSAPNALLLIDMEGPKTRRQDVLTRFDLEDYYQSVFCMIQAMESWILSQPDKIELCFSHLRHGTACIEDDNTILGVNPEDINHPDRALNTILSRYFRFNKNGKTKKLKYYGGKLKIAPDLIELLDFNRLRTSFEDADRLYQKIIELSTPAE